MVQVSSLGQQRRMAIRPQKVVAVKMKNLNRVQKLNNAQRMEKLQNIKEKAAAIGGNRPVLLDKQPMVIAQSVQEFYRI